MFLKTFKLSSPSLLIILSLVCYHHNQILDTNMNRQTVSNNLKDMQSTFPIACVLVTYPIVLNTCCELNPKYKRDFWKLRNDKNPDYIFRVKSVTIYSTLMSNSNLYAIFNCLEFLWRMTMFFSFLSKIRAVKC